MAKNTYRQIMNRAAEDEKKKKQENSELDAFLKQYGVKSKPDQNADKRREEREEEPADKKYIDRIKAIMGDSYGKMPMPTRTQPTGNTQPRGMKQPGGMADYARMMAGRNTQSGSRMPQTTAQQQPQGRTQPQGMRTGSMLDYAQRSMNRNAAQGTMQASEIRMQGMDSMQAANMAGQRGQENFARQSMNRNAMQGRTQTPEIRTPGMESMMPGAMAGQTGGSADYVRRILQMSGKTATPQTPENRIQGAQARGIIPQTQRTGYNYAGNAAMNQPQPAGTGQQGMNGARPIGTRPAGNTMPEYNGTSMEEAQRTLNAQNTADYISRIGQNAAQQIQDWNQQAQEQQELTQMAYMISQGQEYNWKDVQGNNDWRQTAIDNGMYNGGNDPYRWDYRTLLQKRNALEMDQEAAQDQAAKYGDRKGQQLKTEQLERARKKMEMIDKGDPYNDEELVIYNYNGDMLPVVNGRPDDYIKENVGGEVYADLVPGRVYMTRGDYYDSQLYDMIYGKNAYRQRFDDLNNRVAILDDPDRVEKEYGIVDGTEEHARMLDETYEEGYEILDELSKECDELWNRIENPEEYGRLTDLFDESKDAGELKNLQKAQNSEMGPQGKKIRDYNEMIDQKRRANGYEYRISAEIPGGPLPFDPGKLPKRVQMTDNDGDTYLRFDKSAGDAGLIYYYANVDYADQYQEKMYGIMVDPETGKVMNPGAMPEDAHPYWEFTRPEMFMSQRQKDTFNTLYLMGREDEAMDYYHSIENELQHWQSEYNDKSQREEASGPYGWAIAAASPVAHIGTGIVGTIGALAAMVGVEGADNPNSPWHKYEKALTTERDEIGNQIDDWMADTYGGMLEKGAGLAGKMTGNEELGGAIGSEAGKIGREQLKGTGKFLTMTAFSIMDNLAAMAAGGAVGAVASAPAKAREFAMAFVQLIMSSEATASSMVTSLERGMDPTEAALLAIGTGGIEALTERYSIELLMDPSVKEMLGNPKQIASFFLKGTVAEGLEETAADVLGAVYEKILTRAFEDQTQIEQTYNEYLKEMPPEEAWKRTMDEWWNQVALDTLGGAISGGVLTGARLGQVQIQNKMTGAMSTVDEDQAAIAYSLEKMNQDTNSYQMARRISEKQESGKQVSNTEYGRLHQNLNMEANERDMNVKEQKQILDYKTKLKDNGMGEQESWDMARTIAKASNNGLSSLTKNERQAVLNNDAAYNILMNELYNEEAPHQEKLKRQEEQRKKEQEQILRDVMKASPKLTASEEDIEDAMQHSDRTGTRTEAVAYVTDENGEPGKKFVDIQGFETVMEDMKDENGETVTDENGNIKQQKRYKINVLLDGKKNSVYIEDIKATDPTIAKIISVQQNKPGLLGDGYMTDILNQARKLGDDVNDNFVEEALDIKMAAVFGLKAPAVTMNAKAAEELNQLARLEQKEADKKAQRNSAQIIANVRRGHGVMTMNGVEYNSPQWKQMMKDLNVTRRNSIDVAAAYIREAGMTVHLVENSDKGFGFFTRGDGSITIDISQKFQENGNDYRDVLATMGHEIIHMLRAASMDAFNQIKNVVVKGLEQKNINLKDLMNSRYENYASQDETLDMDGVMEEIVAQSCEEMFTSEEFRNRMEKQMSRGAFAKVRNYVREILGKLKRAIASVRSTSNMEARVLGDLREDIAKIWLTEQERIFTGPAVEEAVEQRKNISTETLRQQAQKRGDVAQGRSFSLAGAMAQGKFGADVNRAMAMHQKGVDDNTILRETGCIRGYAKGQYYKVLDNDAVKVLKTDLTKGKQYTAEDIIQADELFEAYPQLAGVTVAVTDSLPEGVIGQANGTGLMISESHLKGMDKAQLSDYIKTIILHELEHFRQTLEGDYRGSSPREWSVLKQDAIDETAIAMRDIEDIKKQYGLSLNDDISGLEFYRGEIVRESVAPEVYRKLENMDLMDSMIMQASMDNLKAWNAVLYADDNAIKSNVENYRNTIGEINARKASELRGPAQFEQTDYSGAMDVDAVARKSKRLQQMAENDVRYSLRNVAPVKSSNESIWTPGHTESWFRENGFPIYQDVPLDQQEINRDTSKKGHGTQIASTESTYRKLFDRLKVQNRDNWKNMRVLDASSGLGLGTQAGREMGFNVTDIEPFPNKSYKPNYTDYMELEDKVENGEVEPFDFIISNAVLNVIPQDTRDNLVAAMGHLLKPGGSMFINVISKDYAGAMQSNPDLEISKAARKGSARTMEGDYTRSGNAAGRGHETFVWGSNSVQKVFSAPELIGYLKDALGDGYTVKRDNIGMTGVLVTKNAENDVRYSRRMDSEGTETDRVIRNAAQNAGLRVVDDGDIQDDSGETVAKALPDGSVAKYSLNSWRKDNQEKIRKMLLKTGNFTETQVDNWIQNVNSIAAIIAADTERLDYKADKRFRFRKPNSDVYKYTLDASTLCKKRLEYQGTLNAIQKAMPNVVLRPGDLIDLANMMRDMGHVVPCGFCYVESNRRHAGNFSQQFIDNYRENHPDGYIPTLADLVSTDGLYKLREEHPEVYTAYIAANNRRGSGSVKPVQMRTDYRRDVRYIKPATVEYLNSVGGLRMQSFSDFETPHLIDVTQALLDMSAKGLKSQAYTKVPDFAWVFGNTGIKINLSLVGEGTGLDADGNLVFSSVEGMDIKDAMKLRDAYSDNVGTILVGINEAHVIAAMGDSRIDYIIPFHKSGWSNEEMTKMKGLKGYVDFTATQNERNISDGKKAENGISWNDYWDYHKTGMENAEEYLRRCAKEGLIPKFDQFLVNNGDGTYSLPTDNSKDSQNIRNGYWKTLIDFKMYNNEGKGVEQQAVTADINMQEARRVLSEYEGGADTLPVAQDVVDKFVEQMRNKETGNADEDFSAEETDTRYSKRMPDMDVNNWMESLQPWQLRTESERQLLQDYKDLRMKIQLQNRKISDYKDQLKTLQAKDKNSLTDQEKRLMDGLKIRIQNAQNTRDELEDKLINVTGDEGYAKIMMQQSKFVDDFLKGKTQDQVQEAVARMRDTAGAMMQRITKAAEELKGIAENEGVKRIRAMMNRNNLDKAAADIRKQYKSNINKQELMDEIAKIRLEVQQGDADKVMEDVEALAGRVMENAKGEGSEYLGMLRGMTITLAPGQVKELLGSNRTIADLRKELAGTGIKVKTAKLADIKSGAVTALSNSWDELCDMIPTLHRDTPAEGQIFELLDFIQGERKAGGQNQYSGQLAEVMSDLLDKVTAVKMNEAADPAMQQQLDQLHAYVQELAKTATESADIMEQMRAMMGNVIKAGQQAATWTDAMKRDVANTIEYFDRTAKLAQDTARNEHLRQVIANLKSEAAQKLLKSNQEWRDLIERDRKARIQADTNDSTRRKMDTVVKRLYNLLAGETDQRNIPEEYKGLARELIGLFNGNDISGRKLLRMNGKQRGRMNELLNAWNKQDGEFDISEFMGPNATEAMRDVGWRIMDDLNVIREQMGEWNKDYRGHNRLDVLEQMGGTLETMQKAVSEIYDIIQGAREMDLNGRKIQIADMAARFMDDANRSTFKGEHGRIARGITRAIKTGNVTPEYFFKNSGNEALKQIYGEFKRSENRHGLLVKKTQEYLENVADKYHYGTWDTKKKTTIQTMNGPVEMTTEQMLSLYAIWNREQTQGPTKSEHLQGGGFVLDDEGKNRKLFGRTKQEIKPHRMNEELMRNVINALTDEQKHFADEIVGYLSTEIGKWGNEATMRMYGIRKYKEKYYFPMKSWGGVLNSSSDAGPGNTANTNRAAHQSHSNRRMNKANNALEIGNFTDVITKHIVDVINENTMAVAVENMNKMLNYKTEEGEPGNRIKRNMHAVFKDRYGIDAYNYLRTFMQDINGGAVQDPRGSVFDKLLSGFRKNAVAGSLSVAAQQPLSYIRAAMEVNPLYLARALSPDTWKGSYKEMMEHSGVAVIKDMGRFDMGFGESAREYIRPQAKQSMAKTIAQKAGDWSTKLPELMDKMTWTRIWSAVKAEQKHLHPEMDAKSDAFLDTVAERFNEVMRRTQVYDSVLVKSSNMRSKNWGAKMMTSFMAEPTLSLNVLMDAAQNVKQKGGMKKAAAAAATFLLSAIAQAAVKGFFGAGRNPDDKKTREENFAYRMGMNLMSEINPMGLVPGYNDLVEILEKGELPNDAVTPIIKLIGIVNTISKANPDGLGYRFWEDTAGQVAQLFTRVPAKNIMRDVRAMINWFDEGGAATEFVGGKPYADRPTSSAVLKYQLIDTAMGNDLVGAVNKWLGDAGYKTTNAAYYDRIYDARTSGDDTGVSEMSEYLTLGKGVKEKTLNQQIAKRARADENLTNMEKAEIVGEYGGKTSAYIKQAAQEGEISTDEAVDMLDDEIKDPSEFVKQQFRDGAIGAEETRKMLKEQNPDKDDDSIWWTVDRMEYKKETGNDAGSGKYYRLWDAMDGNSANDIGDAIRTMQEHGVEDKSIRSNINSHYKELYLAADADGKRKIRDAMQKAYRKLGLEAEDADKVINKWK